MSRARLIPVAWVVMLLAAGSAAAQSPERRVGVAPLPTLLSSDNSQQVTLKAEATGAGADKRVLVTLVSTAPDCRFSPAFEVPVQLDRTAFQLKQMERVSQATDRDGTCVESIATAYTPSEFHYIAAASQVVMFLPTTTLIWSAGLPPDIRKLASDAATPFAAVEGDLRDLIPGHNASIASGQPAAARRRAEAMAPTMVIRPAAEAADFYIVLGLARRLTDDLDGAAVCYQIAWRLAFNTAPLSERAGLAADGLSVVRRLQKNFDAAVDESDRAIRILMGQPRKSYAVALNNRAHLLADQGNFVGAIDYSERALVILRQVLKDEPDTLAPFLEDNRRFRARR